MPPKMTLSGVLTGRHGEDSSGWVFSEAKLELEEPVNELRSEPLNPAEELAGEGLSCSSVSDSMPTLLALLSMMGLSTTQFKIFLLMDCVPETVRVLLHEE